MSSNLPALSGERNVARYLQEIRKFPLLAADEEFMLAKRWREHGDAGAAHRLVTSHLRLVAKIAMGYRGYGLPISELISEGNVGMMQAVKRFEPDKGFRLATYAMWWIRASIQEYILHSWSLVKMGTTAAQKKLFFNLRRAKAQLQVMDDSQFTPEKVARIATDLGVPEQDVVQMNQRLAAPDHSLNAPLRGDGEGDLEWQDWLVDESANQEIRLADEQEFTRRKSMMETAMKTLNERERQILIERRLTDDPATLEDLSAKYKVSRERVRQIENRAFEKLQKAVRALTAEEARSSEQARAAGISPAPRRQTPDAALPRPAPTGTPRG
jgi:RNA polymerase sigma-32 factor